MALAGHDTASLVFNNAATASSYSGTLTGVVAGELIVVCATACADTGGTTPSGWTVTLGSDTLTFRQGPAPTTTHGIGAIFTGVASASGDQTLTVNPGGNLRACTAHAFRITGFDATTPIPNSNPASSYSSDASALTGPNGVTTAANGNAIIGCIGIPGGDTTALAVGAADGSTVGQSGSNAFNDHEWGVAWQRTPTKAAVTFAWTWGSNPARPGLAWVEIAEAASGGTSVALDALAYTATLPDLTVAVNTPVGFDALSYTATLPDVSVAVDTPVALDAIAYTVTLPDVDVGVSALVAMDSLSYAATLPDVTISTGTPVALDALAYTVALPDASVTVDTPVALDSLGYAAALNDLAVSTSVTVSLDALDYAATLPDVAVQTASRARGDDAFRSSGAREEFWRRKAEEWLEEHLQRVQSATGEGRSARKRAARRIAEAAERALEEMPQIAPRIDMIAAFARQLAEERPDFTALAAAVAAQMAQVEAEKRARRRKRDLEAVLLLAA